MTLTKLINSKLLITLIVAWITYCAGVSDYEGAVFFTKVNKTQIIFSSTFESSQSQA